MTMRDLDRLTDALEREARRLDVPAAPTAALVAHGRGVVRRRHRDAGLALLALAVVAGAALVMLRPDPATTDPAGRPNSVADLPVGVRPKVPYTDGIDIVTTDLNHRRVFTHPPLLLGPDVVVVSDALGPGITYSRFDGTGYDALNGTPDSHLSGSAALSADGHWAAAPYDRSSSPVRVQVFDLRKDVRGGIATFDSRDDGFELVGIDNQGVVYGQAPPSSKSTGSAWRWDPATGETRALHGVVGSVVSVRGDGRMVVASGTGASNRTSIGTLDGSLTFQPRSTVTGRQTLWSPDDAIAATLSGDRATIRVDTGTRERLLGLPSMVTVRSMVWEDEADLLVWVVDVGQHGSLLRCRTRDGRCEVALAAFGPDARCRSGRSHGRSGRAGPGPPGRPSRPTARPG